MASPPGPTDVAIVLVQGSFQTPLVYKFLADKLKARGYQVYQPELPSCSNTEDPSFPTVNLDHDTNVVQKTIEELVKTQGKRVFVLAHSYGGLLAGNAIPEELSISARQAAGLAGGVLHIFFFAAFVLEVGQTVLGAFGESPDNDVKPDGRFFLKNGAALLYDQLSEEDIALWGSRMVPQSHAVLKTEIRRAAYKYIPSTYLVCENDKAVSQQYQEMLAAVAGSRVLRCDAGHSPMLNQPDMLVEKVIDVLESAAIGVHGVLEGAAEGLEMDSGR